MSNSSPSISVCIPTRNHGRYIQAAIQSVLQQTERDFEIIVCDDASTDETQQVLSLLDDPRIRYFRQPKCIGIAANRNRCLEQARGRYIAWLDSDDVYYPEMLARQQAILETHPGVGLAHGGFHVIGPAGERKRDWPQPFASDTITAGQTAFEELILANEIMTGTVLMRRECFERLGGFNTRFNNSGEDWEMWLRIALARDIAYTAEPLAQYRQHSDNTSRVSTANGERLHTDQQIVLQTLKTYQPLIKNWPATRSRAKLALAGKSLAFAADCQFRHQRLNSARAVLQAMHLAGGRGPFASWLKAAIAALRGQEFLFQESIQPIERDLAKGLAGSRFGQRMLNRLATDTQWEQSLDRIATTIQRETPRAAIVATVDKWDPALLHRCHRQGYHFPDLGLSPGGYPADSESAIEHLSQLRLRGVDYLIFPSASFWWLEHYREFSNYLNASFRRCWEDVDCIIFDLETTPCARSKEGYALSSEPAPANEISTSVLTRS